MSLVSRFKYILRIVISESLGELTDHLQECLSFLNWTGFWSNWPIIKFFDAVRSGDQKDHDLFHCRCGSIRLLQVAISKFACHCRQTMWQQTCHSVCEKSLLLRLIASWSLICFKALCEILQERIQTDLLKLVLLQLFSHWPISFELIVSELVNELGESAAALALDWPRSHYFTPELDWNRNSCSPPFLYIWFSTNWTVVHWIPALDESWSPNSNTRLVSNRNVQQYSARWPSSLNYPNT